LIISMSCSLFSCSSGSAFSSIPAFYPLFPIRASHPLSSYRLLDFFLSLSATMATTTTTSSSRSSLAAQAPCGIVNEQIKLHLTDRLHRL
jgi:hypothetical protein